MKIRLIPSTLVIAAATACAAPAYDQAPATTPTAPLAACDAFDQSNAPGAFLDEQHILRVDPVYAYEGRPRFRRTLGAEIVVAAQEGQNEAWLERWGQCTAAELAGRDATHPLAVPGVEVDVQRRGANFVVRLTGDIRGSGKEIADRVEGWHQGGSI